ncbi:MAG TPA: family 78 glycoside hydrolase catalytic domain [Fimbriimonas sp.]|nr:family 78 glycoside hydrolase catalytic domain [Fimbriimonas sp.]
MILAAGLALTALGSMDGVTPAHLRCNYLVNPIGIDEAPQFSWVDESSARGARQSAYQIRVASSLEKLKSGQADLWDSGRVGSSESTQIPYRGQLANGMRGFWTVTVWDDGDTESTSKPASFEIGMLMNSTWQAKWMSLPDSYGTKATERPSPMFRYEFETKKGVEYARVHATAKGLYRLFIDGKPVGKDLLAPGWTDYNKRIQYQTNDVTALLAKPGKHAVGMVLGDGWYCGHVGWTPGNNYGSKPEALAQIDIHYKGNFVQSVASGPGWKATTGPILSDDLLMGETYDARKERSGWTMPAYNDSDWAAPELKPIGEAQLVGQYSPTVEQLAVLKTQSVTEPKPNTYVFDLGQNMVGWARIHVHGAAGSTVQVRYAEMLNPDGTIYTANLRGAKATDTYTCKGSGEETYEPTFTFHGFRYVELTGTQGKPGAGDVEGIVVGSANPQTLKFECSNPMLNKLQHNIVWGQRGNYVDIPTDCPQRDERLGWMGDAQIFSRTACYNCDVAAFLTKWTQDVVDAQSDAGGFSDVSPRVGDPADGAPAWGDAGVIVPWSVYLAYGDKDLLEARYPAMRKWLNYIDAPNSDHIWVKNSNNNFGDWLNVGDDTPREVLATAFFAHDADLMSKIAAVLGKDQDAANYASLFEAIKAAFNSHFVDADGKIKGDTQTDYVMALNFGLLPEEMRANAIKRLSDHIEIDRKDHLSTGFIGSGLLNPTLTDCGRTDLAYKLLETRSYPSWLYSIDQGATTIWERWDGWTKEKGFQDPGMNSFNHYSFGAVGQWMYSTIGGIGLDPEKPGFKHIVIHPRPGGDLKWAKTSYDSIRGLIETNWKLSGKQLEFDLTIPANTTATVYVPAKNEDSVNLDGEMASSVDGVRFTGMKDGAAVYEVVSGKYHFKSTVQ